MTARSLRLAASCALAACAGCVSYEPSPLDHRSILGAEQMSRRAAPELGSPDMALATVSEWMATHGPAVRAARAEFEAARARAEVLTPWADPSLQFGPQTAWGGDVGSSRLVTPFAQLSISIPLGDRLAAQDAQNLALAEVARIETVLRLREEYLAVRAAWARLAAARLRQTQLEAWAEVAQASVALTRRQIELGASSALDAGLLELDLARVEVRRLAAELDANRAVGDLAARTGMPLARFDALDKAALPLLPEALPSAAELEHALGSSRPELIRLRADHALAERDLRLQIARQYPDLKLGPIYTAEAGEQRDQLGLGIGFNVPWFDANRQNIAAAIGERNRTRAAYEAGLRAALAELDQGLREIELTRARRVALEGSVLPAAEANVRLARLQAEAGAVDTLRILEVQRSVQELQVETTAARLAELEAWLGLERALGQPLLPFPGEPAPGHQPSPTGDAAEPIDQDTNRQILDLSSGGAAEESR